CTPRGPVDSSCTIASRCSLAGAGNRSVAATRPAWPPPVHRSDN
ncbi:MAG: hypothetical protein AVDCRST_MAG76-2752, partial [uncultured Acidimicrobiales bacterium]